MQAVILAAGLGLRLRPFTEKHPKGLVPIAGKPLLLRTLDSLPDVITEIIVVTGWLSDQIETTLGTSYQGRPILYVEQKPLDGTGSALHHARVLLRGNFLVVNGDDIYTKGDLTTLAAAPGWALLASTTLKPLAGALVVDDSNNITALTNDPSSEKKWINCGAYLTDTQFFNVPLVGIPVRDKTEYSLPHSLTQNPATHPVRLIEATKWLPVGTPEELAKAEKILDNTSSDKNVKI